MTFWSQQTTEQGRTTSINIVIISGSTTEYKNSIFPKDNQGMEQLLSGVDWKQFAGCFQKLTCSTQLAPMLIAQAGGTQRPDTPLEVVRLPRQDKAIITRRPTSADRTTRRQFQATGQPVSRTQASNAMTSRLPRYTAAMRLMTNYFDHLLCLDTPTYTVAQIAKRFEPSTVLWAFHTIQPSSWNNAQT